MVKKMKKERMPGWQKIMKREEQELIQKETTYKQL